MRGGGGTDSEQRFRFWLWPLPPAGELKMVALWPDAGITETMTVIDGSSILRVAAEAEALWTN
jgi:hypothetical protein